MFNMFFCGIRNGNNTYDEDRTLENFLDTYIVTCYQECLIGDRTTLYIGSPPLLVVRHYCVFTELFDKMPHSFPVVFFCLKMIYYLPL